MNDALARRGQRGRDRGLLGPGADDIVGFSAKPPRNYLEHPSFKPWRFELLEYQPTALISETTGNVVTRGKALCPTGRYGWVIGWLQDGDADVAMDDGGPPHLVKWRQCKRIEP